MMTELMTDRQIVQVEDARIRCQWVQPGPQ